MRSGTAEDASVYLIGGETLIVADGTFIFDCRRPAPASSLAGVRTD
jgi:hypothetical protein